MSQDLKTAIIYDWLDKWGGVERVLLVLCDMFVGADLYSSYFDPKEASWVNKIKIKTSFIQKMPRIIKKSRFMSLPFYPYIFESFDLSKYQLVISVTSAFAKSVLTRPETKHICYLLTPTRYFWGQTDFYLPRKTPKAIFLPYLSRLRRWDFLVARRPDRFISISKTVADRCKKYYRRQSDVIYPPFDLQYWEKIRNSVIKMQHSDLKLKTVINKDFFLIISRLEPYKMVDLAIDCFKKIGKNLVVVGEGSQFAKLRRMAGLNIQFFSKLSDEQLGYLYSRAQALIMPQEEDFGYVSLEAQFFGCPVIAYGRGGARETIIDEKTGLFFKEQNSQSLYTALKKFNMIKYQLRQSVKEFGPINIKRFDKKIFISRFFEKISS